MLKEFLGLILNFKIIEMDYKGMTLNERLYHSGKMDEFDEALEKKNTCKVLQILREVKVREESILFILKELKLPDLNKEEE